MGTAEDYIYAFVCCQQWPGNDFKLTMLDPDSLRVLTINSRIDQLSRYSQD